MFTHFPGYSQMLTVTREDSGNLFFLSCVMTSNCKRAFPCHQGRYIPHLDETATREERDQRMEIIQEEINTLEMLVTLGGAFKSFDPVRHPSVYSLSPYGVPSGVSSRPHNECKERRHIVAGCYESRLQIDHLVMCEFANVLAIAGESADDEQELWFAKWKHPQRDLPKSGTIRVTWFSPTLLDRKRNVYELANHEDGTPWTQDVDVASVVQRITAGVNVCKITLDHEVIALLNEKAFE